jgi:hypothetical protein
VQFENTTNAVGGLFHTQPKHESSEALESHRQQSVDGSNNPPTAVGGIFKLHQYQITG